MISNYASAKSAAHDQSPRKPPNDGATRRTDKPKNADAESDKYAATDAAIPPNE